MGGEERQLWLRQRLIWLRARTAEARVERETLLSSPLGQVLAEFGAERALDALYARLYEQIQYKQRELHDVYMPQPAHTTNGAHAAAESGYTAQHAYAPDPAFATESAYAAGVHNAQGVYATESPAPMQSGPMQYTTPYPTQAQPEPPGLGFFG